MLVDKWGKPISSADYASKKDKPKTPLVGELANMWSGVVNVKAAVRQNVLTFDTSRLTLQNYREMSDHYQVNSSVTVLTFMLHQMKWKIKSDNLKHAKHCEENMQRIWTRLVRALSQAFIFGYSPNALRWENEPVTGKLMVTKIQDFRPEDCRVNWKEVDGKARDSAHGTKQSRKVKIYDGIDHIGQPTIPTENSLWYPLLMRNGDYYGKKLLNAAFQPWYFSNLMHVYANRYFERFGEPIIIARAPFDEEKTINGQDIPGNVIMNNLVTKVRSGGSVTLPNDRAQNGIDGVTNYDYQMEFLESQLRGADWERQLTRYDQEISLALFTPLLMMNTADGGSFNLGVVHTQMYQAMIRAIADDWKEYIDRYLLLPMVQQNFGLRAAEQYRTEISFQEIGKVPEETGRMLLQQLLLGGNNGHKVDLDLEEVGAVLGLTLEEGEILATPLESAEGNPNDPQAQDDPAAPKTKKDTRIGRPERENRPKGTEKKGVSVANSIAARVAAQFVKSYREGVSADEFVPDLGFTSQVGELLGDAAGEFFGMAEAWIPAYYSIFVESDNPLESEMRDILRNGLTSQIGELISA